MVQSSYDVKLSESEREAALDVLKEAYALGSVDEREFEQRVEAAMAAGTRGALGPALHGLPGGAPFPGFEAAPSQAPAFRDAAARDAAARDAAAREAGAAERSWGLCAHLLGLCTSFVGPLLMARSAAARRSAFVRRQSLEAANFQLCLLGAALATGLLAFVTFGLAAVLYVPLALAWMVMPFLGMKSAASGQAYAYPLAPALLVPER